jgi:WD40-like Beta Propeller Repeat
MKAGKQGRVFVTNDLQGGAPKEVFRVPDRIPLRDYLWLADGRLIYVLDGPAGNSEACNFWELSINSRTGELLQSPRQLTNEAGGCMGSTSVTADGKHVAHLKWKANTSVYVADFQGNGEQITAPRRLTLDENYNNPLAWTRDSREVLFLSNRNGLWGIFKQAIDGDVVEAVVTGKGITGGARISPDGSWILYQAHNSEEKSPVPGSRKVMRIPVGGGPPEFVMAAVFEGTTHCTNALANLCAFAERSADRKRIIFTSFDPVKGRGHELTRFRVLPDKDYPWSLSPDGKRIAVLRHLDSSITILPLAEGTPYRISVKGKGVIGEAQLSRGIWWTADGKALIMSSPMKRGTALLRLDLKGNATILWVREGSPGTFALASPDGRHLAMMAWDVSSNLWMRDTF